MEVSPSERVAVFPLSTAAEIICRFAQKARPLLGDLPPQITTIYLG
jgi:hypothetical protein